MAQLFTDGIINRKPTFEVVQLCYSNLDAAGKSVYNMFVHMDNDNRLLELVDAILPHVKALCRNCLRRKSAQFQPRQRLCRLDGYVLIPSSDAKFRRDFCRACVRASPDIVKIIVPRKPHHLLSSEEKWRRALDAREFNAEVAWLIPGVDVNRWSLYVRRIDAERLRTRPGYEYVKWSNPKRKLESGERGPPSKKSKH